MDKLKGFRKQNMDKLRTAKASEYRIWTKKLRRSVAGVVPWHP